MEKRRSKGVTFWAWLFIVFSVIGLLTIRLTLPYGIFMTSFTVVSGIAYIICGIYLLKLKNWARKTAIILGILSIAVVPYYLSVEVKRFDVEKPYEQRRQMIVEQVKPEFQQEALAKLEQSQEGARKFLPIVFIIFLGLPILVFELSPIYFFTRPKVIEQFTANQDVLANVL